MDVDPDIVLTRGGRELAVRMAVEIEGQDATQGTSGAAVLPDWLEAEEEDAEHH